MRMTQELCSKTTLTISTQFGGKKGTAVAGSLATSLATHRVRKKVDARKLVVVPVARAISALTPMMVSRAVIARRSTMPLHHMLP